ncbi:hypothetical protein [Pseudidiomarina homiensis]|uniref:Uncharacterized protein n=1 Tax=Pseudidiomarina homiensis TaxID=364198 RepID=A0A432XUK2_9GAMM|nr:hypothetical protein [Pseudidiomarina homiensis]RUO52369.1 hypothetical protein CWI70_11630 [Pseudidiomarina homiensis]
MAAINFLRLGEKALERIANEADIYSLVKGGHIRLWAEIPRTWALLTLPDEAETAVAKAVVEGLVMLRNADALRLLENGVIKTDTVYAFVGESIKATSFDNPFSSELPIDFIKNWAPERYSNERLTLYRAKLNAEEAKTGGAIFKEMLEGSTAHNQEFKDAFANLQKIFASQQQITIQTRAIEIKRLQVLVDSSITQFNPALPKTTPTTNEVFLSQYSIPSYPIILDTLEYLRVNPSIKPANLWKKLREEHNRSSPKVIDVNESIIDISQNDMAHYDANNNREEMSKKRYSNLVAELRKLLDS